MNVKETKITTVTMQDGRVVDFPGKRRLQKTSEITEDGRVVVRLDFINGTTTLFTVPENLLHRFAAHGAEQKLGDAVAGMESIDDATLAVDALIDRLYQGEWHAERSKDEFAGLSDLVRALVEYSGKSPEVMKAFLKDKSVKEKAAMRNSEFLKPIIDRYVAERAAKQAAKAGKVDVAGLLAGLENVGNDPAVAGEGEEVLGSPNEAAE